MCYPQQCRYDDEGCDLIKMRPTGWEQRVQKTWRNAVFVMVVAKGRMLFTRENVKRACYVCTRILHTAPGVALFLLAKKCCTSGCTLFTWDGITWHWTWNVSDGEFWRKRGGKEAVDTLGTLVRQRSHFETFTIRVEGSRIGAYALISDQCYIANWLLQRPLDQNTYVRSFEIWPTYYH